jgi:hypothetical protein
MREADAAHSTAFHQFGFKIFANDQFRRTAADINNQLAAFSGCVCSTPIKSGALLRYQR